MYLALKTLHLLAVVLFLGNIITGLFWKAHADRSADPRIIAQASSAVTDGSPCPEWPSS